jgi:hypothetical protein
LLKYQAGGGFRSIRKKNPGFKEEGTAVSKTISHHQQKKDQ